MTPTNRLDRNKLCLRGWDTDASGRSSWSEDGWDIQEALYRNKKALIMALSH